MIDSLRNCFADIEMRRGNAIMHLLTARTVTYLLRPGSFQLLGLCLIVVYRT